MSFPLKLYRLQQIDTQLDQANHRLLDIEKAINENPALDQAALILQEAENNFAIQNKALKKAEEAVRSQKTKIEQTESTLYSGRITNPKELQDMQNETAALKRYLLVLEDRQLEEMILFDETNEKHQIAQTHYDQLHVKVEKENQELLAEQGGIKKDIDRITHEKQSLLNTIDPESISLYEQLRQKKRGVAVAVVTDKTCSACGSSLTPAVIQTAHSPTQITYCPSCGRVLYGG